jgi:hypothetical protein
MTACAKQRLQFFFNALRAGFDHGFKFQKRSQLFIRSPSTIPCTLYGARRSVIESRCDLIRVYNAVLLEVA